MRILIVIFCVLMSGQAWAACSKPDGMGVEGEIVYNRKWKVMQFCDGQDWRSMDASRLGTAPSGAVMAFDLGSCPMGWSEYVAARGRFLRGIDSTGTIDPSGVRVAGDIQSHMFKQHGHTNYYSLTYTGYGTQGNGWISNFSGELGSIYADRISTREYVTNSLDPSAGVETRPVNVAVLYCRKD